MNPKPLSSLNHFTVPVAIVLPLRLSALRKRGGRHQATTSETRRTALVERTLDPYGQCRDCACSGGGGIRTQRGSQGPSDSKCCFPQISTTAFRPKHYSDSPAS